MGWSLYFIVPLHKNNCGWNFSQVLDTSPRLTDGGVTRGHEAIMRGLSNSSFFLFTFSFFFFLYSCYHESKILRQIDMCHYIIYQKNSIKCNKSGARTDYHFMIKMQKLREMHRDLTTDLVWSFYRINNLMIDR